MDISCSASDTSMDCNISKIFSILSIIISVLFLIYFASDFLDKKSGNRKSRK